MILATITAAVALASAVASAPISIVVQPFLLDLIRVVVTVAVALGLYYANGLYAVLVKRLGLSNDDTVRNTLTRLAWDAAHFGIANADNAVKSVGSINVNDPILASAGNWFLQHACDEIEHFNLSDQEAVNTVAAVIPQVAAYLNSKKP